MDMAEFADLFTTQMSAHLDRVGEGLNAHETSSEARVDAFNALPDPSANAPIVSRLTDIPEQPLAWLWPCWIPAGVLTILGGHVGDGKSTVISALVAALTSGTPLPDGTTVPPVNAIILNAEDDPARVIRPRLAANGADLSRVFVMAPGNQHPVDIRRDVSRLQQLIEENHIRLLVIDPLSSFLRRSDRAGEGSVRDALQPLLGLIAHTGVATVAVMRTSKTAASRNPARNLIGSSALPAIARSVIMVARDGSEQDAEPGRAILQVVKGNYASAPAPVALRVSPEGTVQWLGTSDTGIDDATHTDPRLSPSERESARDFLREFLKDQDIEGNQVLKQAKRMGFSEITIRRAKKDLGVTSGRPNGSPFWMWHLPAPTPARRSRKSVKNT